MRPRDCEGGELGEIRFQLSNYLLRIDFDYEIEPASPDVLWTELQVPLLGPLVD